MNINNLSKDSSQDSISKNDQDSLMSENDINNNQKRIQKKSLLDNKSARVSNEHMSAKSQNTYFNEENFIKFKNLLIDEDCDYETQIKNFFLNAFNYKEKMNYIFDFIGISIFLLENNRADIFFKFANNLNEEEIKFIYELPKLAIKNNNFMLMDNYLLLTEKIRSFMFKDNVK